MTLIEKLFEMAAPHGKFFLIAFSIASLTILLLSVILARKFSAVNKEKIASEPYTIWGKYRDDDGIAWYAISASTMLYMFDPTSTSPVKIGPVANNLKHFITEDSVTKIIDEYFYGNLSKRSAIFVKVCSAAVGDNYIRVETQLGKTFIIKKPKDINSLEVCYPVSESKKENKS